MMWMCHLCFPPVETTHLLLHIELQQQYPLQFILFVNGTKVFQISTQIFVAMVVFGCVDVDVACCCCLPIVYYYSFSPSSSVQENSPMPIELKGTILKRVLKYAT